MTTEDTENTERPTPETDAEVMLCHGIPDGFNPPERSYVTSKFARKLERERDEERANLKITQEAWVKAKVERVEALRERDEAREAFVIATDQMVRVQCNLRDSCREAGKLERERDEAMGRLHPDRALEWLRVHYQAWFGDRTEWSDDIADRFYRDTATLTLFCQNFKFSKEAVK
jgi:hypothetical protein